MVVNNDILIRFGNRVRELRKARGLSQEVFAARCGLDRTYIGGVERGQRNIALHNREMNGKTLTLSISEVTEGISGEGH